MSEDKCLVVKYTTHDGQEFYRRTREADLEDSVRENVERNSNVYQIDVLEMTEEEYAAIPASSEAREFFGGGTMSEDKAHYEAGRMTEEELKEIRQRAEDSGAALRLGISPEGTTEQLSQYLADICAKTEGGGRALWLVYGLGESEDYDDARIAAVTGNGPTSEANARFFARARVDTLRLLEEVESSRERERKGEFTSNDWAVIYRLVDEYTEWCLADPKSTHSSQKYRAQLREKVTRARIQAKQRLEDQ